MKQNIRIAKELIKLAKSLIRQKKDYEKFLTNQEMKK